MANLLGNPNPDKRRFDAGWIGLVLGLVAPLLTLYTFYLIRFSHIPFRKFYLNILSAGNILTASISLCVIMNLVIFFIFIWTNRNLSARGVLMATFVYAGYVVYQKYL